MRMISPTMIRLESTNLDACKVEMTAISLSNPSWYVTGFNVFQEAYAHLSKRLHVHAPSDGWPFYVINGNVKPFTESQLITDQNATPTIC